MAKGLQIVLVNLITINVKQRERMLRPTSSVQFTAAVFSESKYIHIHETSIMILNDNATTAAKHNKQHSIV